MAMKPLRSFVECPIYLKVFPNQDLRKTHPKKAGALDAQGAHPKKAGALDAQGGPWAMLMVPYAEFELGPKAERVPRDARW